MLSADTTITGLDQALVLLDGEGLQLALVLRTVSIRVRPSSGSSRGLKASFVVHKQDTLEGSYSILV